MNDVQAKWNAIYRQSASNIEPIELLQTHAFLLPITGHALDLACGLGGNALWLATRGMTVDAIDISDVALANLDKEASARRLAISLRQCDLCTDGLPISQYDVVVVSRFLDRTLCDAIMAALKPKGLLFYQTFTRDKIDPQGPRNPEYLLARNELLDLFEPLDVVFYQEMAHIGDVRYGNRNEACFIGQKPQTLEYA